MGIHAHTGYVCISHMYMKQQVRLASAHLQVAAALASDIGVSASAAACSVTGPAPGSGPAHEAIRAILCLAEFSRVATGWLFQL